MATRASVPPTAASISNRLCNKRSQARRTFGSSSTRRIFSGIASIQSHQLCPKAVEVRTRNQIASLTSLPGTRDASKNANAAARVLCGHCCSLKDRQTTNSLYCYLAPGRGSRARYTCLRRAASEETISQGPVPVLGTYGINDSVRGLG